MQKPESMLTESGRLLARADKRWVAGVITDRELWEEHIQVVELLVKALTFVNEENKLP